MRLFVGIEFPEKIVDALLNVQNQIRSVAKRGRFVARANLHLTLQFLGEVQVQDLDPIVTALQKIAQSHAPFFLALKDIGSFGNGHPFRVIWVGIDGDTQSLVDLQKGIASSLFSVGFLQEKRPYQPHITLGRDVEFIEEHSFEKYGQALTKLPFPIERFSLIQSTVENGKRVYRSPYSFSLDGSNTV